MLSMKKGDTLRLKIDGNDGATLSTGVNYSKIFNVKFIGMV